MAIPKNDQPIYSTVIELNFHSCFALRHIKINLYTLKEKKNSAILQTMAKKLIL